MSISLILVLFGSLLLINVSADDANYDEVGAWYENFSDDLDNDLPYSDDEAYAFGNRLDDFGWDDSTPQGNAACTSSDWETSGDTTNADSVDIALIITHGGQTIGGEILLYTGTKYLQAPYIEAGDCEWGDTDMEWAVIYACHSLDNNYYDAWDDAFDGLHGIVGFRGMATQDPTLRLMYYFATELEYFDESMHDSWEYATKDFYDDKDDTAIAAIYRARMYVSGGDPYYYDYGDELISSMNPDDGVSGWSYSSKIFSSWNCPS